MMIEKNDMRIDCPIAPIFYLFFFTILVNECSQVSSQSFNTIGSKKNDNNDKNNDLKKCLKNIN